MTRVCPKRDAICPHGMDCPYAVDRYTCEPEPAELRSMRALYEGEKAAGLHKSREEYDAVTNAHDHPGVYLRQLMDRADISGLELATHLNVRASFLSDIRHGRRRISINMAIRLGKAFGPSFGATAKFWAEAQMEWDLQRAWAKFPPDEMPRPLYELDLTP